MRSSSAEAVSNAAIDKLAELGLNIDRLRAQVRKH